MPTLSAPRTILYRQDLRGQTVRCTEDAYVGECTGDSGTRITGTLFNATLYNNTLPGCDFSAVADTHHVFTRGNNIAGCVLPPMIFSTAGHDFHAELYSQRLGASPIITPKVANFYSQVRDTLKADQGSSWLHFIGGLKTTVGDDKLKAARIADVLYAGYPNLRKHHDWMWENAGQEVVRPEPRKWNIEEEGFRLGPFGIQVKKVGLPAYIIPTLEFPRPRHPYDRVEIEPLMAEYIMDLGFGLRQVHINSIDPWEWQCAQGQSDDWWHNFRWWGLD